MDSASSSFSDVNFMWRSIALPQASLFTMVVSIFCSHSFEYLRPDTSLMISALITEMVQINCVIADGTPIGNVPRAETTTFTPMQSDVWVIGLWCTSHALSLSVAVFAMLAKQWIRLYMILPSGDARQRARIRHFRYMALQNGASPKSSTSSQSSCTLRSCCSALAWSSAFLRCTQEC
ncbi:hypothetical protein CPB85DRAFT_85253 [Mucidula mucida]|nr:hypothetical protein CPB85DRAFT_85253 [Mucidula mucida]